MCLSKEENYEKRKENGRILHENSDYILCQCGCGQKLKELDLWGRKRFFISGHNISPYQIKISPQPDVKEILYYSLGYVNYFLRYRENSS